MRIVARDETSITEITRNQQVSKVYNYYGTTGKIADDGPQGFLADFSHPGHTIPPHFHDTDQFQVIVGGDGRLGATPIQPVAFHYADAFTPYGPIVANEEGIQFYSLRPASVGGVFYLPQSRHLMQGKPGRNIAGVFDISKKPGEAGTVSTETLIERQFDGVYAAGIRMGANAVTKTPASDAGHQYILLCDGSMQCNGKSYPKLALMWTDPGESVELRAGPEGAQVLLMQFPRATERVGSDTKKMAGRDPSAYRRVE